MKPNTISTKRFPDGSLHSSGLEFSGRKVQGREGDRKGVGGKRKVGCVCPVGSVLKLHGNQMIISLIDVVHTAHSCYDNNNIKVPILDIVVHTENICTPGRNVF
jgi:hypothetical protein